MRVAQENLAALFRKINWPFLFKMSEQQDGVQDAPNTSQDPEATLPPSSAAEVTPDAPNSKTTHREGLPLTPTQFINDPNKATRVSIKVLDANSIPSSSTSASSPDSFLTANVWVGGQHEKVRGGVRR